MKLIKRHMGLAIVGGLSLVLLVILFVIFAGMIFSKGKSEYGDRLNDIVKIDKKVTDEVIEKVKENEEVSNIKVRTQGKIIYIVITVNSDTDKDRAKEIASSTLEYYPDEVKECYDYEYIVNEEERLNDDGEDVSYTIAGTKHVNNDYISWTRN